MRFLTAITLYRLLLPLLFIAAFPGWLVKMLRRGGLGTRLGERAAIYTAPLEYEPCCAVHFHAVSVGEAMLALKLIREWVGREPGRRFVLATGTATVSAIVTNAMTALKKFDICENKIIELPILFCERKLKTSTRESRQRR